MQAKQEKQFENKFKKQISLLDRLLILLDKEANAIQQADYELLDKTLREIEKLKSDFEKLNGNYDGRFISTVEKEQLTHRIKEIIAKSKKNEELLRKDMDLTAAEIRLIRNKRNARSVYSNGATDAKTCFKKVG